MLGIEASLAPVRDKLKEVRRMIESMKVSDLIVLKDGMFQTGHHRSPEYPDIRISWASITVGTGYACRKYSSLETDHERPGHDDYVRSRLLADLTTAVLEQLFTARKTT